MAKISNLDIVKNDKAITGFPVVVVDQTNVHISDIIRRNLAGEQVLGTTKLAYDFLGSEENRDMEVNPFNSLGFDLDDTILLADKVGVQIADLQDRAGKLDRELIAQKEALRQAKEVDQTKQVQKLENAQTE